MDIPSKNDMVIENVICIEDVKFTLMWDLGVVELHLPKENYFYNKDYTVPIHFHNNYELIYSDIPSEVLYENETKSYSPGFLIIIPPGQKHVIRRSAHPRKSGINASMGFTIKKIPVTSDIPLFDILTSLFKDGYAEKISPKAGEIINRFDPDQKDTVAHDRFKMSLMLHELIMMIINSSSKPVEYKNSVNISDSNATRAYKITMIINNLFNQDITIDSVAKKMKLSSRQISRIIRSQYDCTFKELVTKRRMERASYLLLNSEKTVAEIAGEVGYNASKGFYNAFKKYYGCLPTEYRKKQTENK